MSPINVMMKKVLQLEKARLIKEMMSQKCKAVLRMSSGKFRKIGMTRINKGSKTLLHATPNKQLYRINRIGSVL